MRWIQKMNDAFYDGHDELYHHAKFGEDRTMRAGCRCENMVFFVCYRHDCRVAANCPYCFYSQAKKSGFSPRRGDSLHRSRSNFAGRTGTLVRLAVQNFMLIGAEGWECGPQNIKNFPHFGKESPHRGDSLDRFPKCLRAFIRLTILRSRFKFHVIRITDYGVIAEKPRVGKLGQIFPCTL